MRRKLARSCLRLSWATCKLSLGLAGWLAVDWVTNA